MSIPPTRVVEGRRLPPLTHPRIIILCRLMPQRQSKEAGAKRAGAIAIDACSGGAGQSMFLPSLTLASGGSPHVAHTHRSRAGPGPLVRSGGLLFVSGGASAVRHVRAGSTQAGQRAAGVVPAAGPFRP